MKTLKAAIFDWGDTIMRDLPGFTGPMVNWPHVEIIDGVKETLETIHRGLICCLASNANDSDAVKMGLALERVNIRQYFRYLFTSKELGAKKPDIAFYQNMIDKMGISSGECVVIGNDYEKDIMPAWQTGIKTIWFTPGLNTATEKAADFIIKSMNELPIMIAKMQRQQ
jgi:HAD superfamily hydrolase (TIGR01509 family)